MIKEFKTKNGDGRLIIQKMIFGIGFHLDFCSATFGRIKKWQLQIDLLCIRFWWIQY